MSETARQRPPWVVPAILFVVTFFATLPYWSLYWGMDDEAITVLGVQRLLSGEWPYYHWDTRHTPGSYLLSLPYFALFGTDRLAVRALMGLVAAGTGVLIYRIGKRTLPPGLALLPWLLWTCGGLVNFPILSYHWIATFFTVLALLGAVRWQQGDSVAPYWLGGSLALAFWCLQTDGVAVALLVLFCWLRWRPPGLRRLLLAAAAMSLLLWLPFLPCAGEVLQENFLAMRSHVRFNHIGYRLDSWLRLGHSLWTSPPPGWPDRLAMASHFWLQSVTYAGYYVLLVAGLVLFEWRKKPALSVLAFGLLAWALAAANRQTISYVSFSCPATFLVFAGLISLVPRPLAWAALVGALEVGGWSVRAVNLSETWTLPVITRAGVYRSNQPAEAEAAKVLRAWSDAYFPPGTPVLAYPYLCSLYTTEKLRNPIREPNLTPLLYPVEEIATALPRLLDVEWIVVVPLSPEQMQASYGIPAADFARIASEQLALVTRAHELVQDVGGMRLYRRKSGP